MQKQPITEYGRKKLAEELHNLKMVERPQTVEEIDIARSHGDLKENAEYHAARDKLRFIEARIAELGTLYDNSQVVDPSNFSHDRVMFGSTVTIMDVDSEEEFTYTIVGTYESNPDKGLISNQTPLAKVLMGKEEGDEVSMNGKTFEIIEIKYEDIKFD